MLLFTLATAQIAVSETDQWPQERRSVAGDALCVWNPQDSIIDEWHFVRRTDRRYKTGRPVWGSPAIAVIDGIPMAFIGGYDSTLHALDIVSKERVWFKLTNGEISSTPVIGRIAERDVVYWTSSDRTLYAHFASNGARLWTRELIQPTNTLGDCELSSPLILDDKLYVCCFAYDKALARNEQKGLLIALDKKLGRVLWKLEVSQGPVSSPVGRFINGKPYVFLVARKGLVQAIDVSGEKPVRAWNYQMANEVLGSPVLEADKDNPNLFIGSKFGNLVALNARTGSEEWKRMAGNWIDNTACVAMVDGENVVFAGSHDYKLYSFRASDGEMLWSRYLGGEVYSAPCFFITNNDPCVAVASLDNHLYVIDARRGRVLTSYFTGNPIWDKVSKGETVWGSPAALQAGDQSALVFGSFNGYVYVLPLLKECTLTAKMRSSSSLFYGLAAVLIVFLFVILPVVLLLPTRRERQ